jgi:hypothetical protein
MTRNFEKVVLVLKRPSKFAQERSVISTQLPNHNSTESMIPDVSRFFGKGFHVIVSNERVSLFVEKPRDFRLRFPKPRVAVGRKAS